MNDKGEEEVVHQQPVAFIFSHYHCQVFLF
jgi:hypothetical protein